MASITVSDREADLYRILQVPEDADGQTITASYRRLIFENHPDRNKRSDATAVTARLNSAYKVLSDPVERSLYDQRRVSAARQRQDKISRVILGASKLVIYELQTQRPQHGHVSWQPGIWSQIMPHFPECRARGCLVLLYIEPGTGKQVYQHGDPGAVLTIDPNRGEFSRLKGWLEQCHAMEDDLRAAS